MLKDSKSSSKSSFFRHLVYAISIELGQNLFNTENIINRLVNINISGLKVLSEPHSILTLLLLYNRNINTIIALLITFTVVEQYSSTEVHSTEVQ